MQATASGMDKRASGVSDMAFDFLYEHIELIIGIVSAMIAMAGAFLTRLETRRQRRVNEENLRHSIDAQSLAWGNQCIDTLVKAAMFARTRQYQKDDASFLQQRISLMLALSSLVERGRLFFPNVSHDSIGKHKAGAYRGERPPVLDALMFAYYELEALTRKDGPTGDNCGDFIDDCRRLLVSELQAHIDPRRRDALIGRYDDQRQTQQSDAHARIETLKTLFKSRRPGLDPERRPARS